MWSKRKAIDGHLNSVVTSITKLADRGHLQVAEKYGNLAGSSTLI